MTTDIQQWGARSGGGSGGRHGEQVIYFRKPVGDVENSGWITWCDSMSGSKYRDYVRRGFMPLEKYGVINTSDWDARNAGSKEMPKGDPSWPSDPQERRAYYIWGPILMHPDGPAEFPVEQILSFRWYRKPPIPDVYWPQLAGQKVREYKCPVPGCRRPAFVDIDEIGGVSSLASHLTIMHEWDWQTIMAYGERQSIDFNKADVGNLLVQDFEIPATPPPPRRGRPPKSQVEIETV